MTKTTRVRGYAPWSPRSQTLALVEQSKCVLYEYADYLPLAIRQIFYRLVGGHGYEKTEQAYGRLCETMNRARRAGMISFDDIRDDGVSRYDPSCWDGVEAVLRTVETIANRYTLDRQNGQPSRLFVLCEANGMAPMLSRAVDDLGVSVMSSGGFDSVTAKQQFARELAIYDRAEILHIGDHDPSGVHLFNALSEDIRAFCSGLDAAGNQTFTRLAVTPAQIAEYGLPTAPPKKTDKRSFEGETVQAEALPPDVLTEIVRQAVIERQDADIRQDVLDQEQADRAELHDLIGGVAT